VEIGLPWFDDSKKKTLEEKVDEAKAAYCAKSRFAGKTPDTCFVHPSVLPEGQESVQMNGVRIAARSTIPAYHLLIGVGSENGRGRKKKRKRSKGRKRS
jgi:hypothetical protein